jgi:hypothetical protein
MRGNLGLLALFNQDGGELVLKGASARISTEID